MRTGPEVSRAELRACRALSVERRSLEHLRVSGGKFEG